MRIAAFLFALFAAGAVNAQPPFRPCPFISAGWSVQFANNLIASVSYDQSLQIMTVAFSNGPVSMFANVPFTVMQAFQQTKNPVGIYNLVQSSYHAMFLFEKNNCPLQLQSGGFLWTD